MGKARRLSVDESSRRVSSTSPGYRGSLDSSTLTLAADLKARAAAEPVTDLARSHRLGRAAAQLERCAQASSERWGWRCGLAICPRCECRKAIRYRERLEARLRKPASIFKHVTATVAADDLDRGVGVLRASFAEMKRRVAWKGAVAGGEAHLQVKASRPGSARAFNVHFHAVVELRPGSALDAGVLREVWSAILAKRAAVGNLAVTGVERHWAIFRA